MNLNQKQVIELYLIANRLNSSLRIDYSGRGMFSAKCIGFEVDSGPGPAGFAIKLVRKILSSDLAHDSNLKDILDNMEDAHTDGMGMGAILYFPNLRADLGVMHPDTLD